MPRKPSDPITEEFNVGDVYVVSTREGWLGTSTYKVTARASHRGTNRSASAENETPWESPHRVRLRARQEVE